MNILIRKILKIHRILGLVLAMNFLVLSLTGVVLIWRHEITGDQQVIQKSKFISEKTSLSKIDENIKLNFSKQKVLSIFKGDDGDIQARVTDKGVEKFKGAMRLKYDQSGNVVTSETKSSGAVIDFILKLHRELILGGKGKILVGILGVFFLLTLLSGALIANNFYRKIKSMNTRIFIGRLHKIISVKAFSWILIVTFTGTILAFNSTLIALFLRDNIRSNQDVVILKNVKYVSVLSVYDELKRKLPELEYDFISFPDNEFSIPQHYVVLMENESEHKIAYVNAVTGKLVKTVSLPWYIELLMLSEPLHFGDYGGVFLKIVWSFLGVATSFIPLTGVLNLILRRKYIVVSSISYNAQVLDDSNINLKEVFVPSLFIFVIFLLKTDMKWILSMLFCAYTIFSWNNILSSIIAISKHRAPQWSVK